jgi:hypothetical protein
MEGVSGGQTSWHDEVKTGTSGWPGIFATRQIVADLVISFGDHRRNAGRKSIAGNRAVVRFYNKRGTAEQWIKEGKQAALEAITGGTER